MGNAGSDNRKGALTMASKQKPHLRNRINQDVSKKKRKEKQKTQKPAMESVMVMGPTGKLTMRKRPW